MYNVFEGYKTLARTQLLLCPSLARNPTHQVRSGGHDYGFWNLGRDIDYHGRTLLYFHRRSIGITGWYV
jgi:hypothetical protein